MAEWEKYRPSNGTEGELFMEHYCYRCARDQAFLNGADGSKGCKILSRVMLYEIDDARYPREWIRRAGDTEWPGSARCLAFQPLDVRTKRAKKAWATRRERARAAFAGELFIWD